MRFSTLVWVLLLLTVKVGAQPSVPPKADKPKAAAVKLPDGTVVFLTSKDDAGLVDGVVLSPDEYKQLVEQADALKKARDAAKPVPPSGVAIRGQIEPRGERTVAVLNLTYTFRTPAPRTPVTLGCQRAAVVAARAADGKLPVLAADVDGITVLADDAGEQTVSLDVEVPVSPRITKGEIGFDLGLPKAAISTFVLAGPLADGVGKVVIGTRGAEPLATIKRTPTAVVGLSSKPLALGPTDLLEVSWEPPGTAPPTDTGLSADADVRVRVDDKQIELIAKLRLRGTAREWPLVLPVGAEVSVERAAGTLPLSLPATATLEKPTDPAKTNWKLKTPDASTDWIVTSVVRKTRPNPADASYRGPYPIGPLAVGGAKFSGKMQVFAPPGVRLGFKPTADLRRQDLPVPAEDDLVAVFGVAAAPKGNWLDLDARPATGAVRVRPQHRLKLTPTGWKLESTIRVVPPQRAELEQLQIDLPAGWADPEVGPAEGVEASVEKDGRLLVVRFATPHRAAFDFTLSAVFASPVVGGHATVPLPHFPQADEYDTKLTATAGDGYEVGGSGFGWENGQPAATGEPLKVAKGAATGVGGDFDRGASKVELQWQPFRPKLESDVRADVTVQARQLSVVQTFRFSAPDGGSPAVRLKVNAPAEVVGLKATPPVDALGNGEWEYRPVTEVGKEFTLTLKYAVRLPAGESGERAIPLVWCDTTTSTDAVVRVWGGGGPRADSFAGNWQELPPEPVAERDSLPWFTLHADRPEKLSLNTATGTEVGGTVVERALIQAAVADDGTAQVRGRFALRRWPGDGVELELPPGTTAEVQADGKRVEPVRSGERLLVPIPDAKGTAECILTVTLQTVAASDGRGGRTVTPPVLKGAVYRGPVRWYVACPGGSVPLVTDSGWDAEHRWAWRGYGIGPVPADSPSDMEAWLRNGGETDSPDSPTADAVAVRRAVATPLKVTLAPRWAWVLGASAVGLVLVVAVGLLRLSLVGPAAAVLAVGLACGAVFLPQPTAQAVGGAQPGLLLAVALLAGQWVWRWYRKRKTDRLPTFSRTLPPSDITLTSRPPSRSGSGTQGELNPTGL